VRRVFSKGAQIPLRSYWAILPRYVFFGKDYGTLRRNYSSRRSAVQKTADPGRRCSTIKRIQRRCHPPVGLRGLDDFRCHPYQMSHPSGGRPPRRADEVWIRDISRTGIGIICSQKNEAGDRSSSTSPDESESPVPRSARLHNQCLQPISKASTSIGAVFEGMRVVKPEPGARRDIRRSTCSSPTAAIRTARPTTRRGIRKLNSTQMTATPARCAGQ